MYQDRTGHSLWPTTVAIRDGVYGMYRHDGPSATKSPQYIPDEYGGNVSHNVVDMVKDVAQTIWNSNTIRAGLNNIGNGFNCIYAPVPTPIDEMIGLVGVLYGGYQVVIGFGKIIFGDIEE